MTPGASAMVPVLLMGWPPNTLREGDPVLVWGGSGGLGSMAIQIVKQKGGVPVAVVSSEDKFDFCLKLGARGCINRKDFDHWGIMPHWTDTEAYNKWASGARAFGACLRDDAHDVADGAGALGRGFRHHAGNVPGARGGDLERFIEQAGEALEALLEVLGADVEGGDQRIELHAALVDGGLSALVAAVDQLNRPGEIAAVGIELAGQLAEIGDDLRGDCAEIDNVFFHPVGGAARPAAWHRRRGASPHARRQASERVGPRAYLR